MPKPANNNNPKKDNLQYLRKELYARDETDTIKQRQEELTHLGYVDNGTTTTTPDAGNLKFRNVAVESAKRRRKVVMISAIGALLLIGILGSLAAVWRYRQAHQLKESQIALTVQGPTSATSGQVIRYEVQYANESLIEWQNAELFFQAPAGFRFSDSEPRMVSNGQQLVLQLGTVAPTKRGVVRINGQLLGESNTTATAQAEVFLTPANFPSGRFSKKGTLSTTIATSPLEIAIDATHSVTVGEHVVMPIQIRNISDQALVGAYITLRSSEGVALVPTDPLFSPEFSREDNKWLLPTLQPFQTITRTAAVDVNGKPGGQESLEVEAGLIEGQERFVQHRVSHVFNLAVPAVFVSQSFNGADADIIVEADQEVKGEVFYRNTSTVALRDVIIKTRFDGVGLNPATLQLASGAYDSATQTITWSASSIPDLRLLQPRQEGRLPFSFRILKTEQFPTTGERRTNFALVSTASVDSPNLPTPTGGERAIVSNRTILSLATDLTALSEAYYDDGRIGIVSSGPNPPRVGQETTYTIRTRLGTTFNDVGETRVTIVIPDGVRYTGKNYLTTGEIRVNERTGEIVWEIPLLPGGTGRILPPAELHLQVAITPGENVRGRTVDLVKSIQATGIDQFVDRTVTEDLSIMPKSATIQQ